VAGGLGRLGMAVVGASGREREVLGRCGARRSAARVRFIGAGRRCSAWVEHAKLVLACSNGAPASLQ
jgi:hypothetical protein